MPRSKRSNGFASLMSSAPAEEPVPDVSKKLAAKEQELEALRQQLAESNTNDTQERLAQAEATIARQAEEYDAHLQELRKEGGGEQWDSARFHWIPLANIVKRPLDSERITAKQIAELAEDIGDQGLLQPLILDAGNRPLAGARRWLAIQYLETNYAAIFQTRFPRGIPCFVRKDINWDEQPLEAVGQMFMLQRQRPKDPATVRDEKIRKLAAEMRQDPKAFWSKGTMNKAKGEYSPITRLAQWFGISRRRILQILNDDAVSERTPANDAKKSRKELRKIIKVLAAHPELKSITDRARSLEIDIENALAALEAPSANTADAVKEVVDDLLDNEPID